MFYRLREGTMTAFHLSRPGAESAYAEKDTPRRPLSPTQHWPEVFESPKSEPRP